MTRKMITRAFATILLVLAAVLGTAVAQTTHEVEMITQEVEGEPFPEFFFEPAGLFVEPGDTVRFVAATPHHTVTAWHQGHGFPVDRVPEGVGPLSSPVVPVGETWEYTFTEPGVYDFLCMPHFFFGMVIRVVVGEASGPGAQPIPMDQLPDEIRPAASVLSAPALAPERIIANGTVSWSEIGEDSKVLPPFLQNVGAPEGQH